MSRSVPGSAVSDGVTIEFLGVIREAVVPYMEKGYSLIVFGADTISLSTDATDMLEPLRQR